jgi:ribonuclease-3
MNQAYFIRNANPNNKWITIDHIHKIFKKFHIVDTVVNNIDIFKGACVHESYLIPDADVLNAEPALLPNEYDPDYTNWIPLQKQSYDRLEFLGDRVIDLIIGDYIYHRYPEAQEGFLTDVKTRLVRGSKLCILAKKLHLDQFILVGKRSDKYRYNNDVLEDVFEAFVGALYSDLGCHAKAFGVCKDLVVRMLEKYLNFTQIVRRQDNYKKLLLEYYHSHYHIDPKYVLISTYGPTNARRFKCGVKNIDGHTIATGESARIIDAEQLAAKQGLKYHGVDVYSDSEEPDKEIYSDSDSDGDI